MSEVEFKLLEEPCRFTVLWYSGNISVIKAKSDETFHAAFERHYGVVALETVLEYATGSRTEDFVFDPVKRTWKEVKNSNHACVVLKLVEDSPYPVAV